VISLTMRACRRANAARKSSDKLADR
jgi:hypothetical protein